jgi:hypothetical protein
VFTIAVELDGLRDLLLISDPDHFGEWDLENLAAIRAGLEKMIAVLIADMRAKTSQS